MKIAFYINILANGGAERVVANLANALSADNDVTVITSFPCDKEYFVENAVKRINLELSEKKDNFLFRNIRRTIALRRFLKKNKPDVLIAFMAEPNFRAIIASLGMRHKRVISVRNDPNQEYPNLLFRFCAKTLFRLADHTVFQTEDARKWFPACVQKKSSIILNPVDEVFFNTKFDGKRHDIVTAGRLAPQKNHKLLIKAFAKVADKIEDNLYIYGEGNLRAELEQLVTDLKMENRVFLPGAIKNVADTIKSARLFVLSSDFEGMPNSLMEAMALGISCISTDCPCGGPRMLLKDDCLFSCNNEELLSNLLCSAATLGSESYKMKPSLFQMNAVANKWMEAFL